MKRYDALFMQWAEHASEVTGHSVSAIVDECGPIPSSLKRDKPVWWKYTAAVWGDADDLTNVQPDAALIFPDELRSWRMSRWCGSRVEVTHPLIALRERWFRSIETMDTTGGRTDFKQFYILLSGIAKRQAFVDSIGDFSRLCEYLDGRRTDPAC